MNIEATDVGVQIEGRSIFSDVSVDITPSTMTALTGPSGSGKTTLLNCLGLIQRPTRGAVLIDGQDTTNWRDRQRTQFWKDYTAFIYQDYGIIEDQSVAYNVTLSKHQSHATISKVEEILTVVGLAQRGGELAAVLSGGEKQRLGVARAIFKDATFIFADEPTASLDTDNRQLVISLLRDRVKQGTSVVIATHDSRLASVCDLRVALGSSETGPNRSAQPAAMGGDHRDS